MNPCTRGKVSNWSFATVVGEALPPRDPDDDETEDEEDDEQDEDSIQRLLENQTNRRSLASKIGGGPHR